MRERQVYNPFLPLSEYIPDSEPHVFGNRVYIYGSHDREGGYTFCMEDYTVWSAPVDDLTQWRCEGVSYRAEQDPLYPEMKYMYAPDVVCGNDGRYYLYYCMSGEYGYGGYCNPISAAVSDKPQGPFEYLGTVKNKDGSPMMKYVCFDPAVMNDDGVIRLYYGTRYGYEEEEGFRENEEYIAKEMQMFGRTREEILERDDSIMGAVTAVLEDDMITVRDEPYHIIPYRVRGTDFEEHPFFEGSSMRKLGGKYYFIYSSWQNHELCYAVSDKPDRDFVFGGTLISNGDIGYQGRKAEDKLNMTGTTHGSIENINGQLYVFYHRLTHKSDYSRQACAERISINADGSISQAEMTSCGLNGKPLTADGDYPAAIACNLTNGNMPHGSNSIYKASFPNITHKDNERFIGEVSSGTLIGYKYFSFRKVRKIGLTFRTDNELTHVTADAPIREDERWNDQRSLEHQDEGYKGGSVIELRISGEGSPVGIIPVRYDDGSEWHTLFADVDVPDGIYPLYLTYHTQTRKMIQIKDVIFEKEDA